MNRINTLAKARQERGVLIAAHRGMAAGNIPCNTMPAFEAALRQGADMLETDVIINGEGKMFIFHTRQERNHLNLNICLEQMTEAEILQQRFVNTDNDVTPYGVLRLDDFLEAFKNRCLINLDHGWDFLPELTQTVRRHGMEEQILLKTPAKIKFAEQLEAIAPDMMFMPIYKETDHLTEQLERMNVNFVGAELVFASEDSPVAQDAYIQAHHDKGRMLWCNPILYSYKAQLTAGHNDDVAITSNPEFGWGWLIDKQFDILQTDWVLPMRQFINNRT